MPAVPAPGGLHHRHCVAVTICKKSGLQLIHFLGSDNLSRPELQKYVNRGEAISDSPMQKRNGLLPWNWWDQQTETAIAA